MTRNTISFSHGLSASSMASLPPSHQRSPLLQGAAENSPEIFRWFLLLRWVAVFGQLACILSVHFLFNLPLLLRPLLALVVLLAVSNIGLTLFHRSRFKAEQLKTEQENDTSLDQHFSIARSFVLAFAVGFDLLLLTALLYFSGGTANPCSIFFMVNLCLGGVMLPPRSAWILQYFSLICFGVLLWTHYPLTVLEENFPLEPFQNTQNWMLLQFGFFMAYALCSIVITYFTTLLTSSLRERESQLRIAEQSRARGEKLEALGTLAAGAAHELSSPLSTIAIVSKELQRDAAREEISDVVQEDIRLIRSEVDRCRTILNRMSAEAGQQTWEQSSQFSVSVLFDSICNELPSSDQVQQIIANNATSITLEGPLVVLAQALRGLVENGLEASPEGQQVTLQADEVLPKNVSKNLSENKSILIQIIDQGKGIPANKLARVGEPFFTTKPTGQGMGLGIFLARSVLERIGGTIEIDSNENEGTTVSIVLVAATSPS